jgi:hypothetical protein
MKRFFKRIIDKYHEKKNQETTKLSMSRKKAEEQIEQIVKDMTSKFCPIMRENCHIKCSHFQEGHIFLMHKWGDLPAVWLSKSPRCKLWKTD